VKSKGITNAQIADNTITVANMGNGSVTSDAILNGTIVGGDLASGINIDAAGAITAETLDINGNAEIGGNLKVTGTIEGGSPVKIAGGLNVLTGNVGIGTTAPKGTLQVTTLEGAAPSIFVSTKEGNVGIGTTNLTGKFQVTTLEGAVPSIFVTSDGRVGIGTTDPEYKLYVDGSKSNAQAMYCKNELSSGNPNGLYIWTNVLTGTGTTRGIDNYSNARNADAMGIYNIADASRGFSDQYAYGIINDAKPRGAGEGYGVKSHVWNDAPSGASVNYGYYADVSGAANNYGVYTIAEKNYFSGNVGIGTTNPTSLLTVNGTIETTNDAKIAATKKLYLDGGGDTYVVEPSPNTIDIYVGAVKALTITSKGHLMYGQAGALPQARAYLSATQTPNNGDVKVNLNTWSGQDYAFDLGSGFAAGNAAGYPGEYRVQTAGYYIVSGCVRAFNMNAAQQTCPYISILNSSHVARYNIMSEATRVATVNDHQSSGLSSVVKLNKDEYLKLGHWTADAAYDIYGGIDCTWMSVSCIQPTE
jgi:hypothetical protein